MSERERLVLGRNFIETLVLTLIRHELSNPSLEVREMVTMELEEELCGLSYAIPFVENVYRESVIRILKEMFPDLVLPDLRGCFIYDQIRQWMNANRVHIFERRGELLHAKDVEKRIRELVIRIVRSAVLATLYRSGLVSLRP